MYVCDGVSALRLRSGQSLAEQAAHPVPSRKGVSPVRTWAWLAPYGKAMLLRDYVDSTTHPWGSQQVFAEIRLQMDAFKPK